MSLRPAVVSPTAPPEASRIVALDWLRTLAVASLFFYHSALVYSAPPYGFFVLDPEGWWGVGPVLTAISTWRMPLMFLVAGVSAETMLRRRTVTAGTFLRLRARRLIPPFVVGMVLLAAPQRYFDDAFRTYLVESPLAFARHAIPDVLRGDVGTYHLWFLIDLALITLGAVLLRFAARAVRRAGSRAGWQPRLPAALGRLDARPAWAVVLFGIALAATALHYLPAPLARALDVIPGVSGAGLPYYALFFLVGMVLARVPAAFGAAQRYRRLALGLAVGTGAVTGTFLLAQIAGRDLLPVVRAAGHTIHLTGLIASTVSGTAAWFGVVAALGYASRYLTRETPMLLYVRDASFAWYLIHQTVIVALGHAAAQSTLLPPPAEFLAVVLTTLAITASLYEFPIRRTRLGRLVFGLPERVATAEMPRPIRVRHAAPAGVRSSVPGVVDRVADAVDAVVRGRSKTS